jgi:hypothetical protein
VALWGETGVGKSHTAFHVLSSLTCLTTSLPASLPLPRLVSALPQASRLPAWSAHGIVRLTAGENLGTDNTVTALATLLAHLAPIVVHLEDLHKADPAQLELLQRLAARIGQLRGVALLVTSRPDPGPPFSSRKLLPLTQAASNQLLETRTGAPLPSGAGEWIFRRAAGNPLFTLEYHRHLTRQGFLWSDGQQWRWREPPAAYLPTTVEALIEQLIATACADDANRRVLEARAYLPADIDQEAWREATRLSHHGFRAARLNLTRQGILTGDAFAHPLFHEMTLGSITATSQRELARHAVTALQHDPVRAADFVSDAALDNATALDLLERATSASSDPVLSAQLQAQAVPFAHGPARTRLALAAAKALLLADRSKAVQLLEGIVAENPDEPEASLLLAAWHAEHGDSREVDAILERLEADGQDQLRLIEQRTSLRFALEDYAGVLELWSGRPAGSAPKPAQAYYLSFAQMMQGQYEEAEKLAASAFHDGLPHLWKSYWLTVRGLACHYRRDAAAGPLLSAALSEARLSGGLSFVATALHHRSMFYEATNQVGPMRQDVDEALKIYAQVGTSRLYARTLTKKARIEHELGNYEAAEELFLEARSILGAGEPSIFLVTCEAQLSSLYLDWQPPYGAILALTYAEAAERNSREVHGRKQAEALYHLSLAESRLGHYERALILADRARDLSERLRTPLDYQIHHGRAVSLQGLGELEAAERAYRAAETLAREGAWYVYAEKIGLEADRLRGDVQAARARLAWFERHGLKNGVLLARRCFPELAAAPAAVPVRAAALRLELLGPMRLGKDGVEQAVQGRKRRELLALLLEARVSGRGEVTRISLLDALYPAEDELKAASSLKGLVHNIRRQHGAALIITTADGYALGNCVTDVEEFLQGGDSTLWRGHYQEAHELNAQVRESLYLALSRRAEELLESDAAEAARLTRLLIEAEPYALDYLRLKLSALRKSGSQRVETVYRAARERMREVGELLPGHWKDFLPDEPA